MTTSNLVCSFCGEAIEYWKVNCRCGTFVGFPNTRAAEEERSQLLGRYEAARDRAVQAGFVTLVDELEKITNRALPVINMSVSACDDILRSGKYRSYHHRLINYERDPANEVNDADRTSVGSKLFPMYFQFIVYGTLSPDCRGLSSYEPIAVCWNVTPIYLSRRLSLLEENSYSFFNRHRLGALGAIIPLGYRAVWEDRAKLAVAKIGPGLNDKVKPSELPGRLLHAGSGRGDDQFIEVHIYAPEGLDTRDVASVMRQQALTDPDQRHRWNLVRETCARRGIRVSR